MHYAPTVNENPSGSRGYGAALVRDRQGRPILQVTEDHVVTRHALQGRPDGIEPGGFASFYNQLANRLGQSPNGPFTPQDWMEADREFTLFQQRRVAALTAADEAFRRSDPTAAQMLYRVACDDAEHCLAIVEFAAQHHPRGELSAANRSVRPGLTAARSIAQAYLAALSSELEGAVACLQAGQDLVTRLLGAAGVADPLAHASIRDLRIAEQTIRAYHTRQPSFKD